MSTHEWTDDVTGRRYSAESDGVFSLDPIDGRWHGGEWKPAAREILILAERLKAQSEVLATETRRAAELETRLETALATRDHLGKEMRDARDRLRTCELSLGAGAMQVYRDEVRHLQASLEAKSVELGEARAALAVERERTGIRIIMGADGAYRARMDELEAENYRLRSGMEEARKLLRDFLDLRGPFPGNHVIAALRRLATAAEGLPTTKEPK